MIGALSRKFIMTPFSRSKYTLVLVRHGESTWNNENKFTGWFDCPLSEKGNVEASSAGMKTSIFKRFYLLRLDWTYLGVLLSKNGNKFDIAYTSMLRRAIRTLWHSLEQTDSMSVPIKNAWELNERFVLMLHNLCGFLFLEIRFHQTLRGSARIGQTGNCCQIRKRSG